MSLCVHRCWCTVGRGFCELIYLSVCGQPMLSMPACMLLRHDLPDHVIESMYPMLRNSASGPEIGIPGRISAGFHSGKPRSRPSGRPKAGRRADFEDLPTRIRPKAGPEARCPARKHYCVKSSITSQNMNTLKEKAGDLAGSGSLLLLYPVLPPARFLLEVAYSRSPLHHPDFEIQRCPRTVRVWSVPYVRQ